MDPGTIAGRVARAADESGGGVAHPDARLIRDSLHNAAGAAGERLIPASMICTPEFGLGLTVVGTTRRLVVVSAKPQALRDFEGEWTPLSADGAALYFMVGPLSPANAAAARGRLPFTAPQLLGRGRSIGLGDRLGNATAAHAVGLGAAPLRPAFAQQSVRELARTGRTPQQVLDDATWGVLQAAYRAGYGADADHLKQPADIDAFAAAGFTLFTLDPGDWIDTTADALSAPGAAARFADLPWEALETRPADLRRRFIDCDVRIPSPVGALRIAFAEEQLMRVALRFAGAIARVAALYRHLLTRRPAGAFELELSLDETDRPLSTAEHYFVATELRRLGVAWHGLAPRLVGRFEKGVDYIGDVGQFRTHLAEHLAVARHCGGYKLSLHSGSDKFRIYPIAADVAGDDLHVKTAGTSYVEALRVVARVAPALFRDIVVLACERFADERRSYHISADAARVPAVARLPDEDLPALLDQPDTRQVLHVTFGAVLTARTPDGAPRFRERVREVLAAHEAEYHEVLARHIAQHVRLLSGVGATT